jgi:chemotaxis protein methyltransferase CheR
VRDQACVHFLQWALPQLHMRWEGFRKVHKRVCKGLARRLNELQLADLAAYRMRLAADPEEWQVLDGLCRVVISRYFRDKLVFNALAEQVLPAMASQARHTGQQLLNCWSIGSASGEEPYTLAILWDELLAPHFPELTLRILATELDPVLLQRSARACYPPSAVRNLPEAMRSVAFTANDDLYCLKPAFRTMVEFRRQDIRSAMPDECFALILCRNLVFTYYDAALQRRILRQLIDRLLPGGWLVLGVREQLPPGEPGLETVSRRLGLYRKVAAD